MLLWLVFFAALVAIGIALRFFGHPPPWPVIAALALIPIVFFSPTFVSDLTILPVDHAGLPPWTDRFPGTIHNDYLSDVATQFVPWAVAVRDTWRSGAVPWRNPWTGCGTPLAANGQSAAFSPLTLLLFLLPVSDAFAAAAAIKLLVALAGTWLWLRALGLQSSASLFGAVSFSLSIAMTGWLLFPHTAVLPLWPWAFAAIELLTRETSRRRAFWLLVVALSLWPLGGHIESAAFGALFGGVWLLVRIALGDLPRARGVLRNVGIAAALALSLTAFTLIPQTFAIRASHRLAHMRTPFWTPHASWIPHGPVWPNAVLTSLFPRALGDAVDSPLIQGHLASPPEIGMGYFGIAGWTLLLAGVRPGHERWKSKVALAAPLVLGLGAAIGVWPFAELSTVLPGLRHVLTVRFLALVPLAGAALAALELDRLERELR